MALLKLQKNVNSTTNRVKYVNLFDRIENSSTNVRYSSERSANEDHF